MAEKILGLDIGSFSIKAALFEATFRTYQLTDLFESPPLKMDDLDPVDQQAIITEAILRIIQDNHIQPAIVVISLSGTDTSTKELVLPLPESQIEKVLPFELEGSLPFELENLLIDHHVISAQKNQTYILSAAVLKTTVEEKIKMVKAAGVDPAFISLGSASLYNLFLMEEPPTDEIFGIIDIGHMKTSFCFIRHGAIDHVRSLYKGGYDLSSAIREKLDLTQDQAVEVKHQHAIVELPDQPLRSQDLQRLSSAIKSPVDDLAGELLQTINAYLAGLHSENPESKISKLYLCGGTSLVKNLPEYFTAALGIPCLLYEPQTVQFERAQVFTEAMSLGLRASIRGAKAKKVVGINFRKGDFALAKDMSGIKAIATFLGKWVGVLFLAAMVLQSIDFYTVLSEKNKLEAQAIKEFRSIVPDVKNPPKTSAAAVKMLTSKIREYKDKQDVLTAGLGNLTALSILRQMSLTIPNDITVDMQEISIDRNKVTVRATTDSLESVDRIISSLKNFKEFGSIDKGDIKETPDSKKLFTLNITIGQKPTEEPVKSKRKK